jgi:hypothetical protein
MHRLFTYGIGRPSIIQEQEITAPYPSMPCDSLVSAGAQMDFTAPLLNSDVVMTAIHTCKPIKLMKVLDTL